MINMYLDNYYVIYSYNGYKTNVLVRENIINFSHIKILVLQE